MNIMMSGGEGEGENIWGLGERLATRGWIFDHSKTKSPTICLLLVQEYLSVLFF